MSEIKWEEQQGDFDIWLPKEKGMVLEGEVVEINHGQYGTQITVKDAKGELNITPSHKVLQVRLKNVTMGDRVRIVYQGTDLPKIKGHNPTQLYTVYKEKPQSGNAEETI